MATKCVLCGKEIENIYDQNNPWPLACGEGDVCCTACNEKVIEARLISDPKRVMNALDTDEATARKIIQNAYDKLRQECKKEE